MNCMMIISHYHYDDIDHHNYHYDISECHASDIDCRRLKSKSGSRKGKNSWGKLKKKEADSFDENPDASLEDVVDLTRVCLSFALCTVWNLPSHGEQKSSYELIFNHSRLNNRHHLIRGSSRRVFYHMNNFGISASKNATYWKLGLMGRK